MCSPLVDIVQQPSRGCCHPFAVACICQTCGVRKPKDTEGGYLSFSDKCVCICFKCASDCAVNLHCKLSLSSSSRSRALCAQIIFSTSRDLVCPVRFDGQLTFIPHSGVMNHDGVLTSTRRCVQGASRFTHVHGLRPPVIVCLTQVLAHMPHECT